MTHDEQSRREFLQRALLAGTAVAAPAVFSQPSKAAAPKRGSKLNLGVIGVAGRGGANLNGVSGENIVALCDIDRRRLKAAAARFPKAKTYEDYRDVFRHDLDGVVVSTPDHMHAFPVVEALKRKLNVYCEKPLTHSISEARLISRLTAKNKAVTQMGNQIHNHPSQNYRRAVEIVQAGLLGAVKRVHVWQGGGINWQNGVKRGVRLRKVKSVPPKYVSYDRWLGPAPYRPYHISHFHFNWRYWWDFGGGQLADFICHYMDLPYWALDLRYPQTVVAVGKKGHDGDNDCPNFMKVDYRFTERGKLPPVHVTWYHGGWKPKGAEVYKKSSAVLFEGSGGRLLVDYTSRKLFLASDETPKLPKPSIPDSKGHHREWLDAVRAGNPNTTCNFQYGALITECGHLGNLSYRLGQKKFDWDAANTKAVGVSGAEAIIKRPYRKGWKLAVDESG
ncbi:MAG: Gfo/Idh/MocA family protein [Planctomycetaceae bacterium]